MEEMHTEACISVPALSSEELSILRGKMLPLFGKVVLRVNGGNRADGNARTAVDAFNWIDKQHLGTGVFVRLVFLRVDTIYGASIDASRVFSSDAGFSDYIGHKTNLRARVLRV
jgi:hypothetical protein